MVQMRNGPSRFQFERRIELDLLGYSLHLDFLLFEP